MARRRRDEIELRPSGSSEVVRWVEQSLDRVIEVGALPPSRILRDAEARGLDVRGRDDGARLRSLQGNDLRELDAMARSAIRTYAAYGAGQGFVTGLGGVITLPITVPTDVAAYLMWIVRVNSAVMQTYGFEAETEEGRAMLRLGLAAGLGVSKLSVLGSQVLVDALARQVLSSTTQDAVVVATAQAIARRVGLTLTKRHIAKAIPVLGGGVNAAVSGGLVYGFGRGAMEHYRGVLIDRGGVAGVRLL
jgi:hypothetical protein